MGKQETLNNINTKGMYKAIARIAVPIALQGLISSSLSLIDNIMIGSLGEEELAATGVCVQIFFVYYLLSWGFSAGCATFLAQFFGAGDFKNFKKVMGIMFTVVALVGVIFISAFELIPTQLISIFTPNVELQTLGKEYMRYIAPSFLFLAVAITFETSTRTIQKPQIPLVVGIIAFGTNTFLNYVLIFGHFGAPALGVKGAALATTIARVFEAVLVLAVAYGLKLPNAGRLREYTHWPRDLVRKVFKNAIPTSFNEAMWALGTTVYVAAFARAGVTAYAAIQGANTIFNIFQMAAMSVGDAALVIIGNKLGEGALDEAKVFSTKFLKAGVVTALSAGVLVIAFGTPVSTLFNFTPLGLKYLRLILVVFASTFVFALLNMIIVTGILRAGGDTRFAMVFDCGSVWAIGIPLAFLTTLVFHWPIYLCVLASKMDEVVKLCIMIWRYKKYKWLRNMVEEFEE